jgi:hypothetical protein
MCQSVLHHETVWCLNPSHGGHSRCEKCEVMKYGPAWEMAMPAATVGDDGAGNENNEVGGEKVVG